MRRLLELLQRLDGRGYKAYKDLRGRYTFPEFALVIDHVQGDPFAAPTRARALVPPEAARLPEDLFATPSRRVGSEHFLAEAFAAAARRVARRRGTGHSGQVSISAPAQQMLWRTAVRITPEGGIAFRFTVGLPAAGRRILGREAVALLTADVPAVVRHALDAVRRDPAVARRYAETNEDADFLRSRLPEMGLVAFVADGSLLPRRSGVDDRPLLDGLPFHSPDRLRVQVHLPNAGAVTGMGVPQGVTLIVGGGFHGKSTLLNALALGVYNHKPGDGRERVVTVPQAVSIRAEDGRAVAGVDISAFIANLPFGRDTTRFTTANASGSTSQAANIMEALEMGARLLLIDEDTAATNFMIRDRRMQALVPKAHEPITPFIDRVRQLYAQRGVSTVLVVGGSGDYLDVADTVIALVAYRPEEVTEQAREIAHRYPTGRQAEAEGEVAVTPRVPLPGSVDTARGKKAVAVKAHGVRSLQLGRETIDLQAVAQLVHPDQTRAIGLAIGYAVRRGYLDGRRSLGEVFAAVWADVQREGLEVLGIGEHPPGDLAAFRPWEWAAALNRLRTLRVKGMVQ